MPPSERVALAGARQRDGHLAPGGRRARAAGGRLRAAAAGLPPHRGSRRERALPLSHRPLGATAANARLLLHDGLRGTRAGRGDGAADPRVPQADPRREARRGALQRARARGLRVGPRDPRGRDRAGPRALRPAACRDPTGSSCGASGARSDACSGSAIATFLPRGGSFSAHFERTVEHTLAPTAAVEEVLDALARPAPPELSRAYRPLWSLTSRQLEPRHLPDHRRTAAGEPADTLRHPLGAGPGARAASPRRRAAGGHTRDACLPAEHRARLPAVAQPGARTGRGGLRPARLTATEPAR